MTLSVPPWDQGQRQDRTELESRGTISDASESQERQFESEDVGQTVQGSIQWCAEWTLRLLRDGQSGQLQHVELLGSRTCHRQGLPRSRGWGDEGEVGVSPCDSMFLESMGKGSLSPSSAVTSECRCDGFQLSEGWEQGSLLWGLTSPLSRAGLEFLASRD